MMTPFASFLMPNDCHVAIDVRDISSVIENSETTHTTIVLKNPKAEAFYVVATFDVAIKEIRRVYNLMS